MRQRVREREREREKETERRSERQKGRERVSEIWLIFANAFETDFFAACPIARNVTFFVSATKFSLENRQISP